ncbi:MAG: RDD family protein [Helicobacteraceae bacterium]|jgi:uncharacterized RDD family membrane protein YckC|nr:RDD family protein [Helicobacteraceae bacterium]
MDAKFIDIVERAVRELGREVLTDPAKYKAHLAGDAQEEFKKERRLLALAIEAGAGREIVNASDLAICKKQQIRFLKDDRFIDEAAAAEVIDLLALILRGDRSQSIIAPSSSQSQNAAPPPNQPSYGYNKPYAPQQPRYNPPERQAEYAGFQSEREIEYVGFWARLAATIIDAIAISIILFGVLFMLASIGFFNGMYRSEVESIGRIIGLVITLIYIFAFWLNKQATPGKMIFGAVIVDAKTLGKPSTGQFIGRYFAYILSGIPLYLGYIWAGFDEKKRGWHDMLAGTLVIKQKKR